jgi:hypothetical protein
MAKFTLIIGSAPDDEKFVGLTKQSASRQGVPPERAAATEREELVGKQS